jgi:hypothetical protein
MARIPNTRPTVIYWLIDVRPEILREAPSGIPFYCGKTILRPKDRFQKHTSDANKYPAKAISVRLNKCGNHIRVQIMETVSPSDDWAAREKFWIRMLRLASNDAVNITAGGQGVPGYIPSAETRAKRSVALKGRVFTAEHRANIGKASANRSAETRAKMSAWQVGKKLSAEHRAKVSAAGKGRKLSDETRARMSATTRNRDPEKRARAGAKLKGRVFSAETIARMSAAQSRRYQRLRDANVCT